MRYRVMTWDVELQRFTAQEGVSERHLTLSALRRALRRLREIGYQTHRPAPFVSVEQDDFPLVETE